MVANQPVRQLNMNVQENQMPGNLPNLTRQKQQLLDRIVTQLSSIAGMSAVVLGGSYASGTQHKTSDMDIGLYYFESKPFSTDAVRHIAEEISVDGSPTVTGFYEWGAWVNGGAWIRTKQGKIDFLYRNIDQVQRTITDAQKGIMHHDYDQQPPNGFYSVTYLAETQICIPRYDPEKLITGLKNQVELYPLKLKQKIVAESLWSAEFTLLHARGFAAQADIYNTAGCLIRVVSNLTQALFALNERYFIRDKMVMNTIASFHVLPSGYIQQINRILANPGSKEQELQKTVSDLEKVWHSVVSLPETQYEPKFQV
jgi:predicted nucleotidyltransferase